MTDRSNVLKQILGINPGKDNNKGGTQSDGQRRKTVQEEARVEDSRTHCSMSWDG
ncbi:hypothetical protein MPTK2_7g00780 [Marchantia polymorpha subsp. ruderalis]